MKVIIFPNDNGGVTIITPTTQYIDTLIVKNRAINTAAAEAAVADGTMTDDEAIAYIAANEITAADALAVVATKDVPAGKPYEIVDDATLPWDQPRESWEWV